MADVDEGAAAELEIAFGLERTWRRWFSTSLVENFPANTRVVPWHGPSDAHATLDDKGATGCSLRKP